MKKLLMVLALVAFTTSAYAATCKYEGKQVQCQWASGCWNLNDTNDEGEVQGCATMAGYCGEGKLYTGASTGNGADKCAQTGTVLSCGASCAFEDGAVVYCDYGELEYNAAGDVINGGCYPQPADVGCTGGFLCTQSNCSDSPRLTGGASYCWYDANEYNDYVSGCYLIADADDESNCTLHGTEYNEGTCGGKKGGGVGPIVNLNIPVTSNVLTAMHNAVNLQVTTGAATLSIYDMKGKVVRTQKIGQSGSFNVQLQLPRGLYIVQATSGSWKQTVKVTVK
jgi:hypothetical protein